MAWLDDNPPETQQYRCPRREPQSGVIGIHTAESFPDEVGPDDGAENVARFIRDRTNYGSYHDICDSDSIIHLVRDSCVAYHIAPLGINEHSYGISAATQAHKWNQVSDEWKDATVRNMARAAARYARRNGLHIPARWLTRSQAANRVPGFVRHSVADPDRRRDPGAAFPANTFLAYYREELDGRIEDVDLSDKVTLSPHMQAILGGHEELSVGALLGYAAAGGFEITARMRQKVNVLVDAVSGLEGVDAEALAEQLNRIDVQAVADAVADEQAERLAE